MRAIFVYEAMNFTRGLDPKKAMDIGMHPRYKTKSWKILDFIGSFGKEGVRYSDIQKFIYFELNNAPFGPDYFSKEPLTTHHMKYRLPQQHRGRGYWGTNLYGTSGQFGSGGKRGLLSHYCHKNKEGKWVLDHYPQRKENIY